MLVHSSGAENTPISLARRRKLASSKTMKASNGRNSRILNKTLSKATKLKKSLSFSQANSMMTKGDHSIDLKPEVDFTNSEAPFRSIENLINEDLNMTPQRNSNNMSTPLRRQQSAHTSASRTEEGNMRGSYSSSIKQRLPSSRIDDSLMLFAANSSSRLNQDDLLMRDMDAESHSSMEDDDDDDDDDRSIEINLKTELHASDSQADETSSQEAAALRKRKRKSPEQLNFLAEEFEKNPYWSKEKTVVLAEKTGLSEAQVYKWSWDQRRKRFGPDAAMKKYEDFTGLCSQNSAISASSTAACSSGNFKKFKEDPISSSSRFSSSAVKSQKRHSITCGSQSRSQQKSLLEDVSILDTAASFAERFSGNNRNGSPKKIPDFRYDDEEQEDLYMGVEGFNQTGVENALYCNEEYRPSELDLRLGELSQNYRRTLNETLYGSSIKTFEVESHEDGQQLFDEEFEAILPQLCDDHLSGKIQTPIKGSLEQEISCFLPENDAFKINIGDILRA